MDFRNYIPPDGGHVGCGIWQSRSLVRDSGSKGNKWTKERRRAVLISYVVGNAEVIKRFLVYCRVSQKRLHICSKIIRQLNH